MAVSLFFFYLINDKKIVKGHSLSIIFLPHNNRPYLDMDLKKLYQSQQNFFDPNSMLMFCWHRLVDDFDSQVILNSI
jgi:hypothetical protein